MILVGIKQTTSPRPPETFYQAPALTPAGTIFWISFDISIILILSLPLNRDEMTQSLRSVCVLL